VTKQRRLGRGLEALLGGRHDAVRTAPPADTPPVGGDNALVQLSVYEVDANPFQPRRDFNDDEINTLAESIRQHGMVQPIVVRRHEGRYQLISGERRLRAAIKAGWSDVAAKILEADDQRVAELAIVENLQRKDLNPLEKAASFQAYLQKYGCTQDELAGRLQIDRSTIANLIRLLELPEAVQRAVRSGTLSQGHARALLPLGDEREQTAFCERIGREGLSVRATEQLVQETIRAADGPPLGIVDGEGRPRRGAAAVNHQVASLEQELRTALGTKVDIRQSAKGRGRIVIHFTSHDEFERLRHLLAGDAAVSAPQREAI